MPFLFFLASLFSLLSVFLSHYYDWSSTTLMLVVVGISFWCDCTIIFTCLGDLRSVWYAFDYKPQLRHYPTLLRVWVVQGYKSALLLLTVSTLFGAALGGGIGWLSGGAPMVSSLALLIGAAYALPMLLAVPYLAHRYAEAQRFVTERLPAQPDECPTNL